MPRVLSILLAFCVMFPALFGAAPTDIGGTEYYDLHQVAKRFGMKAYWLEKSEKMRLKSAWTTIDFTIHRREAELNGIQVHLGDPIAEKGKHLFLSRRDLEKTFQPILTPQIFDNVPRLKKIVIDPGHGGKDPGARNPSLGLYEKHLALDVANRLKKLLLARGFEVSLTRESDRYISLQNRASFANRTNADLFISIHFNAVANKDVHGIETFAFTPRFQPSTSRSSVVSSDRKTYAGNRSDPWNILAAYYIQRELLEELPTPDRGVKRARFAVLRDITMPGVLLEGGFVSHDTDGRNIGSAGYRQRFAESILKGIMTYQKTIGRLQK